MSRTYKDEIKSSWERNQTAPYWKYQWVYRHGCSHVRKLHNRIRRAKAWAALLNGRDAEREVRYLPWIWW